MTLLQEFLVSELSLLLRHRIRLRVIGETSSLPFAVRKVLERTVSATAGNTEMTLTLGLSYAGRNEIVRAARRLAAEAAEGRSLRRRSRRRCSPPASTPRGSPIPTSSSAPAGFRISNFLLWQSAYAEFAFTDVLWPDFGKAEFLQALEEYSAATGASGLPASRPQSFPGK